MDFNIPWQYARAQLAKPPKTKTCAALHSACLQKFPADAQLLRECMAINSYVPAPQCQTRFCQASSASKLLEECEQAEVCSAANAYIPFDTPHCTSPVCTAFQNIRKYCAKSTTPPCRSSPGGVSCVEGAHGTWHSASTKGTCNLPGASGEKDAACAAHKARASCAAPCVWTAHTAPRSTTHAPAKPTKKPKVPKTGGKETHKCKDGSTFTCAGGSVGCKDSSTTYCAKKPSTQAPSTQAPGTNLCAGGHPVIGP